MAPNAKYESASLAPYASIWYGAAVVGNVSVGERTGIHDGAQIDGSKEAVTIGSDVTVGVKAKVHSGANLKDGCVISHGAIVGLGATVGEGAVVAPGSHIEAGVIVERHQVWSGVPAVHERDVTPEEADLLRAFAARTSRIARVHDAEWAKHPLVADEELEEKMRRGGVEGLHTGDPELWRNPHIDGLAPRDDDYFTSPERFHGTSA